MTDAEDAFRTLVLELVEAARLQPCPTPRLRKARTAVAAATEAAQFVGTPSRQIMQNIWTGGAELMKTVLERVPDVAAELRALGDQAADSDLTGARKLVLDLDAVLAKLMAKLGVDSRPKVVALRGRPRSGPRSPR